MIKRLLILTILFFVIQFSFGQACGPYRLLYSGEIESDSIKVKYVKLPFTFYLHGIDEFDADIGFIEIKAKDNKIKYETYSHLTSVYKKAEQLIELYKSKRTSFPIIIAFAKDGKVVEITKEVSWNEISIKVIPDDAFGTLFKLDLKVIKL